ncbi:MAG: glucose-6-phosphate isomerase [Bacteroidetes bacterium CG2_30_32_10]|nr:MAG: glucose-6-phosphate isomerase [Bacteroidetes bacterium CG2_30_32_10]
MNPLTINIDRISKTVSKAEIDAFEPEIKKHIESLYHKTGKGNDFLGWLTLLSEIDNALIKRIENDANRIKKNAEIFIVIGIGGSYLGARAVIDALSNNFSSILSVSERKAPLIIYAGNNISEDYLADLLELLDKKEYAIAVVSKSGTTTEPAIAFRILKQHIEKKYGKVAAKDRIIAITDKSKGALKKLADKEGYSTYTIPDNVGGRYSVLTPVGLLPIAVAGFDISKLIEGAKAMKNQTSTAIPFKENPAAIYAAARNALLKKGKSIEVLASFTPNLHFIIEWWKQLYGESEGKEGKGIFPAGVDYTSDLHSMGQYLQEGKRNLFETVISVGKSKKELRIPFDTENADGLNFIAQKKISEVNKMAELGTMIAHVDGDLPNILIYMDALNEENIGQLIYFFEMACAISGYLLGVNPFDQPGVEAYKNNMFALLGKPGFEKETEIIRKRL